MPDNSKMKPQTGFSLTELLLVLLILAQIAVFSIPKVLNSQANAKNNAIAKEAMGTIAQSLQLYRSKNTLTAMSHAYDLVPYTNYVKQDSTSLFQPYWGGTDDCSQSYLKCYRLHNGGLLVFWNERFDGITNKHMVWFDIDPDATGPAISLEFVIYTTGLIRTVETLQPASISQSGTANPTVDADPDWFSWE